MKTVWVVEQGSYSDYHVIGVFSSKENADLIAALERGSYNSPTVSEWPLDPAIAELSRDYRQWRVVMLRDGSVETCDPQTTPTYYDLAGSLFLWERTKAPAYAGKGIPDALQSSVWAKDRKHAVKIVNEQRTQMIAEGKWVAADPPKENPHGEA